MRAGKPWNGTRCWAIAIQGRSPASSWKRSRPTASGSRWPSKRVPFPGLPARICWLGYGERAKAGLAFNELVLDWPGQCADRHRSRPPGRRFRRLAKPRDRGDGRRLRAATRSRILAAAQRPGQYRRGRVVGLDPPWRRGRDRLFAARRDGRGGRRDATGGREARTGPDDRSRPWVCCVTSTRGTRAPFRYRASAPFGCRCSQRPDRTFGRCRSAPLVGRWSWVWLALGTVVTPKWHYFRGGSPPC